MFSSVKIFYWITVTDQFYKWIKQKENEYKHILTEELKIQAYKLALDKRICLNTMTIIAKIFHCDTSLDIMVELIKESIRQKKFKEASKLNLVVHYFFTVSAIFRKCKGDTLIITKLILPS